MYSSLLPLALAVVATAACGHDDSQFQGNESEVITTVLLSFTPQAGGSPTLAVFDDPDGDGGEAPTIDAVELAPGIYSLEVALENRLEFPPEDITIEVADESAVHQIFFTGTAVEGPAANNVGAPLLHSYGDQDANGLPLGLVNDVSAATGSGNLTVTLRHLPPVAGINVKTAATSSQVRDSGFAGIGGSSDAQVTFPVVVQ